MAEVHPLKRRSIKPSSSTVRGMLPAAQCRMLDAAMQSVRSTGLRLEWVWRGKSDGWVCAGFHDDFEVCLIIATETPPVGRLILSTERVELAKKNRSFPKKFKPVLDYPVDETKVGHLYEFPLEKTPERDLYTEFIEAVIPLYTD